MDEMKFDMCGAASVFGSIHGGRAKCSCRINLVGMVPATENLPDGDASKPGDVVTSMSRPDDRNTQHRRRGPPDPVRRADLCRRIRTREVVIDIATLTGACVVALGHHASRPAGQRSDPWPTTCSMPAQTACDRAWQLPLWDDYEEQLKQQFRRHGQHRRPQRRRHHRRLLPGPFHQGLSLGAPGHRRRRPGTPARTRVPPGGPCPC